MNLAVEINTWNIGHNYIGKYNLRFHLINLRYCFSWIGESSND